MSITVRITLLFLLVAGAGFLFFARSELNGVEKRYREAAEEPLVDVSYVLSAFVGGDSSQVDSRLSMLRDAFQKAKDTPFEARIYDFVKSKIDLRVHTTDEKGVVTLDTVGRAEGQDYSMWRDVRAALRGEYGARSSHDDPAHDASIMYVTSPLRVDGNIAGTLSVGKPNDNANHFILAAKRSTLYLGILSFLAVGTLGVLLSRVVTRPLASLTGYVRAVRDGRNPVRPNFSAREIESLGVAFDEMREALEGRKYIERYVQTLTHELKSPLTGIRGAVELLKEQPPERDQQRFLENIEVETGRIQGLVEKLLMLSTLQSRGKAPEMEQIALSDLFGDVAETFRARIAVHGITIQTQLTDIVVTGNRFWLMQALGNLIENAVEFSPVGGTIEIAGEKSDGFVSISVQDSGPGIPEWAIEKVFEQFYSLARPSSKKRSSGVGLTIVREVAALHGGKVLLENRGGGGAVSTIAVRA